MKILKILIVMAYACLYVQNTYALDDKLNYTLTLTLVNHTNQTLSYVGVNDTNPGNVFQVSPTDIFPGGTATITAKTTEYYDMEGKLRFKDNTGSINLLKVQNQRHINYAQPQFTMLNENYVSYTDSHILNKDENTRALMSSAATVFIERKF